MLIALLSPPAQGVIETLTKIFEGKRNRIRPSPVVELNRAVAVSMASGPAAGLEPIDTLVSKGSLKTYHLQPSVRGELLKKLSRQDEAVAEFARAALTSNAREWQLLIERARECGRSRLAL